MNTIVHGPRILHSGTGLQAYLSNRFQFVLSITVTLIPTSILNSQAIEAAVKGSCRHYKKLINSAWYASC